MKGGGEPIEQRGEPEAAQRRDDRGAVVSTPRAVRKAELHGHRAHDRRESQSESRGFCVIAKLRRKLIGERALPHPLLLPLHSGGGENLFCFPTSPREGGL